MILLPVALLALFLLLLLPGNSMAAEDHITLPHGPAETLLNNLLPTLDEDVRTLRRRNLATQSWVQFNTYFSGDATKPSPLNLPTYFGQNPGPCPMAAAGHTTKCYVRACKMSPTVRAMQITMPVLGTKRLDEYVECDDCARYPGDVWLYDLDAGNLRMGGIYLDISDFTNGVDNVAPPGTTWAPAASQYGSETIGYNQFRMDFILSEVQLDADLKMDIERMLIKISFRIIFVINLKFELNKHGMVVKLRKADQLISSSDHAISFRSLMTFRANKACIKVTGPTRKPTIADVLDTTCVYRADKIVNLRSEYYRSNPLRTESFLEGIVYDINLPRTNGDNNNPAAAYDATACQWDFVNPYASVSVTSSKKLQLGMTLDIGPMCAQFFNDICRTLINWILNLIIGLILKQLLCELFTQLFWMNSASGTTPTSEPGLFNIGVRKLYNFMKKYVETPLSTRKDAETLEDVTIPDKFVANGYIWPHAGCATSGFCPHPDAFDFNNSGTFKSISLGINGILGNLSTTAGYTDKLVIVEVIDILVGNKVGDLPIGICPPDNVETCTLGYCAGTCDGDIKKELELQSYPNFTWTGQPVFDGKIQLNGLLLKYVNSFTTFKIIDNGYTDAMTMPTYTHTLMNQIYMQKFGIELYIVITLTDGFWVHRPRYALVPVAQKRSINMATNIYVELANIDAKVDVFMLLEGGRLNDKYIGSIFGNWPKGSLTKRLHCAANALDLVQFSRLQVSAALTTLKFSEFLGDLGTVVERGTKVFNMGYKVATNLYLKFLADNWIRPMVNDYLMTNTFDGICGPRNPLLDQSGANTNCTRPTTLDKCALGWPYYFAPNDINRYINFSASRVWNLIKGVVNDLIGGIPVRTGSASINQLIDTYLEMYIPVANKDSIRVVKVANDQVGMQMGNLNFMVNAIEIRSNKSSDNFFRISDFQVRNIETIHELSLYPTTPLQPREFSVYFKLGGGKIWDRTNNKYIVNGNLLLRFHLATEVVVPVEGKMVAYAEDQADFGVEFGNITFNADIYALLNQNDVLDIKFGDITKLGCLLSVVDQFELRRLFIAFQSFKLNVARQASWRHRTAGRCGGLAWNVNNTNPNFQSTIAMMQPSSECSPARVVHFSDSLDYLAWETLWWGKKVNDMLQYIFNGVSKQAKDAINAFAYLNPSTVNCASYVVGSSGSLGNLASSTANVTNQAGEAMTYWERLTSDKVNPRFPRYPKGTCSNGGAACQINYASGGPPSNGGYSNANTQYEIGLPANYDHRTKTSCVGKPNANKEGACWEKLVEDDENAVDLRDNFVVRQVKDFVQKSGQKLVVEAMNAVAESGANNITNTIKSYKNNTALPGNRGKCRNMIDGEASYCIDLDANLTQLGFPTMHDDTFIPGLIIAVKRLRVLNLHTFDADPESFNLMYNYIPNQYDLVKPDTDALYTLAHRIMFGSTSHGYLEVSVDIDVTVAREFLDASVYNTTAGKQQVTDSINLEFKFAGFDLQVLSTTAFNASRILEVPFYYMLDPMSSKRCLYSIFYQHGLFLPQLQLQVADLIGPVVTITPKTPNLVAANQANIFSKGVGYLITSTIEIMFQLTKSDIPDMTQGALRDYVNRVLGDIVNKSRDASGPGSCKPPVACGPPSSMCHYQKFNDASFVKALNFANDIVGGDPVKTGILSVNSIVDMGLNYAILDKNGPLLLGSAANGVKHDVAGTWFVRQVLKFQAKETDGTVTSYVELNNVGIKGLNSIYKLKLNTYSTQPYTMGLDISAGGGIMLNGSKIEPEPFRSEPLTFQMELNIKVVAKRLGGTTEVLADNEIRVELEFLGVNVSAIQQVLANKTDLYSLSITQVSKTQCMLAFIDKYTLERIMIQISDFNVNFPTTFGRDNYSCKYGQCNLGRAVDLIRGEAAVTNLPVPPAQSRPLSMLNLILDNVGHLVEDAVNTAKIFNQTTYKCEVPKVTFQILSGVYTKNDSDSLIIHLLRNVTGILALPRPRITADFSAITLQSTRANKPATKTAFINEVIKSATWMRGTAIKDRPVVLQIGSVCDTFENMNKAFKPVCTTLMGSGNAAGNISNTLASWTSGAGQVNFIDTRASVRDVEGGVRIDFDTDTYYDIRTSAIVRGVSNYFEKSVDVLEGLLRTTANKTELLRVEADNSITLYANITDLMLMIDAKLLNGKMCDGTQKQASFLLADLLKENDALIPGMRILPGMLEIRNFGSFSEITLLKPYSIGDSPDEQARFTTKQQFGWRRPNKPMNISVGIDMFFNLGLTQPELGLHSGQVGTESMTFNLVIYDLYVQVLTLLAVDTTTLGQIRLGDFLNVDENQKFLRNCKAGTCLLNGIFDGGIQVPQLTVNVSDVVGPTFRTKNNKLFSKGMEAFIDAVLEIGVQLFRDDITALTQGPLRSYINNKLEKMLGDSKVPGACPERRNYTRDYPLGPNFCSHNDTTGVSPLLTQREADCVHKKYSLNGATCQWTPPDVAVIDATTVACFYTKQSKELNFQNAVALRDLKHFVNNSLLNEDSTLYMNNILGAFASNLQSKMYTKKDIPLKYNGASYGTCSLGIGEFTVRGLDTVDRLEIFDNAPYAPGGDSSFTNGEEYEPVAANKTTSGRRQLSTKSENFGYQDNKFTTRTAIGFTGPFRLSLRLYMEFNQLFVPNPGDNSDGSVINDLTIEITLSDFDIAIDLFMLVNVPRLMDLQVRSIGTIYELPCILEIFEDNGLVPVQFNMTYGAVGFEFCATEGDDSKGRTDSPMLKALQLSCFNDGTSNDLARTFTVQLQRITDYLIQMAASSELQSYLNTQISISNTQCEAIKTGDLTLPDYTTGHANDQDAASAMGIAGLALIFTTLVAFAFLVPVHFRRRDELMKRALLDAHERGAAGKSKDEFELAERRLKSAFAHPCMPKYIKYGVPIQIAINVIYFATANFGAVGCNVELTLAIAGSKTYPIVLLPFTLASSINHMWNAGVYPLAIIIALASGAWPYAKQIMLLFGWFAPSTVLHPMSRGRLFEILDTLGKWSLIDIYVLVLLMVAFRFYLSSSMVETLTLLPPNVVEVDVNVTPGWGIFGFCLGAMGSLLVNHVMVWYNRQIIRADEDFQDAILGTLVKDLRTPRIPLSKHRFNILDAEGRPYRFSAVVRIFIVFILVVVFFVLIIGSVIPVMRFTFRGVAGLAIGIINADLGVKVQSIVQIGTGIIDGAKPDDTESVLGIIFLQILYILFSLVVPLATIVVLLVVWLVPLTLREQILLYFLAEVLSAWEACLILCISLLAAVLQISQLAQFIVDNATAGICGGIQNQLQKIFPDPEDAKCFDVIAQLLPESGVIWFGCVGLLLFGGMAFRLCEAAIHDRELAMRRKPPHSPGEMTGCQGFYVRRSLEAFGQSQVQDGGGNVANAFAQNQGAFNNSVQITNPVMSQELYSNTGHNSMASNPMFAKQQHASLDV